MTINWEGGFQYGGACTADGLAEASAAFPGLPGVPHWLSVLDAALEEYLQPPTAPHMVTCGTHFPYGCVFRTQHGHLCS